MNTINELLSNHMVGQPYLFAKYSYGNELTIHFGKAFEHHYGNRQWTIGSHVLSLRASPWIFHSLPQQMVIVNFDENYQPVIDNTFVKSGTTVTHISAFTIVGDENRKGIALIIHFEDGSLFQALPISSDETISDWELLMPNKLIKVRGSKWEADQF